MRKRTGRDVLKLAAFLLLVAAAAYVLFFTSTGALFRTAEGRSALVRGLDTLVQAAGPLGPVLFIFVYALGVLILPATPFTIAHATGVDQRQEVELLDRERRVPLRVTDHSGAAGPDRNSDRERTSFGEHAGAIFQKIQMQQWKIAPRLEYRCAEHEQDAR